MDVLRVGLGHDGSNTIADFFTATINGDLLAGVLRRGNSDGAAALSHDLIDSLADEETVLTLGKLDLDGGNLGLSLSDDVLNSLDDAGNALAVARRTELAVGAVEGELNIRTTGSLDEDGAASLNEGNDVSRNVADALGRLCRLRSDNGPEDLRGLLGEGLSASNADRDSGFFFVLVDRGGSARARMSVSVTVGGGEVVATRDVNPDVDLVANLLEVGT